MINDVKDLSRVEKGKQLARKKFSNFMGKTFVAVIVGAGEYARYDKETGIYVIPITALGA